MPVASPAQVVSLQVMVSHRADRCRPRDEAVLVIMAAVVVEIADKRQLARKTFPNQILPEKVRDKNLLAASFIDRVQIRVGIFLAHIEGGDVVLPAVIVVVTEKANAEIGIVENETAEIAHKRLHADAQRDEVIVVR